MSTARKQQPPPQPVTVLRGHRADVSAARFHPNGMQLLTADALGEIRLWDVETRRPLATVAAHDGRVLHVHVAASGEVLSQGRNGCVRLWEAGLEQREPSLELRTGCFNFCRLAAHAPEGEPPSRWLVALPGGDADDVGVWEMASGRRVCTLRRRPAPGSDARLGMVTSVAFESAGSATRVLVGGEDGSVCLWDTRSTGKPLASCAPHTEPVLAIAVLPRLGMALTGSADRRLCALALPAAGAQAEPGPGGGGMAASGEETLAVALTLELPVTNNSLDTGGVNDIAVRADARIFATAGWDRRVRVWELGSRWRPLAVLRHHTGGVSAIDFSPSGEWLASASADKTVALWSVFPQRSLTDDG
ncbi:quinon protein alcohol dehydrogenase-like superfamily [Pavlovales sp. CCMP2436]|nr:quinon protein alcohol dehydrogenase-like superfamily [Pavlovales sp. CCMP2436]